MVNQTVEADSASPSNHKIEPGNPKTTMKKVKESRPFSVAAVRSCCISLENTKAKVEKEEDQHLDVYQCKS